MYNMDKLYETVSLKGPVCVGLDTAADYIPSGEYRKATSDAEAMLNYNKRIIDAVADIAACFKVQIAYYEAIGLAGLRAYAETLRYIRDRGILVIADVKRGDIADTAIHYAKAHFTGDFEADFVTLSPYMGMDAIEPWLLYADNQGKGAFVLMRTSNKGMRDFEYQELKSRGRLYDLVGDRLTELAVQRLGKYGYGAFGAVAGCTEREEARAIRKKQRALFFLIPGYGAQGGAAEDAALLLSGGNGGVVNASRSILNAWKVSADKPPEEADNTYAAETARNAVIEMRNAIRTAVQSGFPQ